MLDKRLTLLILSCDKFSDLWPAHTKLLNQNWPDRNIRTVILTDIPRKESFPGVEIIGAGYGTEFTERIRHVLPLIDTEYVLVTLDDYFPTTPIRNSAINRIVDIMSRRGYDYIRLYDRPHCPLTTTPDEKIFTFSLDKEYRVNLYAGMWRKNFISRTLGEKVMNPWEFEVTLTERARQACGKCAVSHGDEFPIMDVVRKGRILPNAWHYLHKHGLYHGERPMYPYSEYFLLGVKTKANRILAKLPGPIYHGIKNLCVRLGMKSFSAKIDRK